MPPFFEVEEKKNPWKRGRGEKNGEKDNSSSFLPSSLTLNGPVISRESTQLKGGGKRRGGEGIRRAAALFIFGSMLSAGMATVQEKERGGEGGRKRGRKRISPARFSLSSYFLKRKAHLAVHPGKVTISTFLRGGRGREEKRRRKERFDFNIRPPLTFARTRHRLASNVSLRQKKGGKKGKKKKGGRREKEALNLTVHAVPLRGKPATARPCRESQMSLKGRRKEGGKKGRGKRGGRKGPGTWKPMDPTSYLFQGAIARSKRASRPVWQRGVEEKRRGNERKGSSLSWSI